MIKKKLLPSFNKIQKKIKFLTKPNNINKVLMLIGILLLLFLVHKLFLSKEGFESSTEDLEENIGGQKKAAVLFYADWCGHCKKFMGEWDKLSKDVNDVQENVKIIKVNCGNPDKNKEHKRIMDKHSIEGYPTIKIFENGKESEYNGNRTSAEIKKYLGI